MKGSFLLLVTAAGTTTSGSFELASFRSDKWFGVAVGNTGSRSKVSFSLTVLADS